MKLKKGGLYVTHHGAVMECYDAGPSMFNRHETKYSLKVLRSAAFPAVGVAGETSYFHLNNCYGYTEDGRFRGSNQYYTPFLGHLEREIEP